MNLDHQTTLAGADLLYLEEVEEAVEGVEG